jgi:nitrite reductase (NO-forming)
MREFRQMRKQLSMLSVIAGVLAAACGGAARTGGNVTDAAVPASVDQGGAQQVTLALGDSLRFAPQSVVVRAGQPVELTLRNEGGVAHDFAITDGVSSPVKVEAQSGQTAHGTFTIDAPGTYTFICTVPGHAAAGMRGTITVRSS